MAKKRGNRKAAEFDDNESSTSTGTMCSNANGAQDVLDDGSETFEGCIDKTYEKRYTIREQALGELITMMRESYREFDCAKNEVTLTGRCLSSLRKGGQQESALAASALGLHIVTLGESSEKVLEEVSPDLEAVAKNGKGPAAKVSAIEALAVVTFVCSEGEHSTLEVLEKLRRIWGKAASPQVKAAGIRSFSFLVTSLEGGRGLRDSLEDTLGELGDLLHDQDVEVRSAAGEAIAVLYHYFGLNDLAEEDEEDDISVTSGTSSMSGLEDVMERMKDLASNKGDKSRRSRRDRATLRSRFRGLCTVLEDGLVKSMKVKLQHGDSLIVNTLEGVVMMNYLKKFLAGGFQAHLQNNPLMHAVFDFTPLTTAQEKLSALEKRAYRSPSSEISKYRTQSRKQDRAFKGAAFLIDN